MLIVTDRKNAVGIRRVLANDNGYNAVERFGATRIDVRNARVGVRRMQNLADQHPGHAKIVVYLPPPVVFSAASTIAVGLPMMLKSVIGIVSVLATRD